MRDVMSCLEEFSRRLDLAALPDDVRRSANGALANIVGVSIGGSRSPAAQCAIEAMAQLSGQCEQQAHAIGVGWGGPADRAALVNGVLAHVLDYDDTHLATVYHPSAPVFAALGALAEWKDCSGAQFAAAWVTGLEVGIRLAIALGRPHYDAGWHVTGTAGGVAAAAACANLLGLAGEQFVNALSIAATQAGGHREQFGAMTKSLHAGIAGQTGLTAAILAAAGFTGASGGIDGRRGLLAVMAPDGSTVELTRELGTEWRLLENCLKPYACGVVTHPAIDATRALREEHGVEPADVQTISLRVNPLVLELTGNPAPRAELEAKFSVYHCAAVGLLYGAAGPRQFADDVVTSDDVVSLRDRIEAIPDPAVAHMTAIAEAQLRDGSSRRVEVRDARGTLGRMLSDDELRVKFVDMAEVVFDPARAQALYERWASVDQERSMRELVAASIAEPPAQRRGA